MRDIIAVSLTRLGPVVLRKNEEGMIGSRPEQAVDVRVVVRFGGADAGLLLGARRLRARQQRDRRAARFDLHPGRPLHPLGAAARPGAAQAAHGPRPR